MKKVELNLQWKLENSNNCYKEKYLFGVIVSMIKKIKKVRRENLTTLFALALNLS